MPLLSTSLTHLSDAPPLHLPDGGGDDEGHGPLLPLGGLLYGALEEAGRLSLRHPTHRILKGLEAHLAGQNQVTCREKG